MAQKLRLLLIVAGSVAALGGSTTAAAQAATPIVITGPAVSIGVSSAAVTGLISPQGNAVAYAFQYGTTTKYGQTTPTTKFAPSTGTESVTAILGELKAGTTYHFRLVVVILGFKSQPPYFYPIGVNGTDRTFATINPGRVTLLSNQLQVRRDSAAAKLKCVSALKCKGRLTLTKVVKIGHRFTPVTLGSADFALRPGRTGTLNIGLSHLATSVLLLLAPKHTIAATLTGRMTTGQSSFTTKVTLAG